MNKTISTFMGIGLTVVVIAGLLFFACYDMIEKKTNTGSGSYRSSIEAVNPPSKTAPAATR
jgi:hypothetical protein